METGLHLCSCTLYVTVARLRVTPWHCMCRCRLYVTVVRRTVTPWQCICRCKLYVNVVRLTVTPRHCMCKLAVYVDFCLMRATVTSSFTSCAQVCLLVVWVFYFLLGVHAFHEQLCIAYTALLLMHLPWPEPSWFYSVWFACNWPTFAPKGQAKQSEESFQQEVADYQRENPANNRLLGRLYIGN